jgi:oxygen-dependent protoporphyrinogen oxidase
MTGRVAVVGAGVAGLTTAYRLRRADPAIDVTALEAEPTIGGRLRTVSVGDLELEAGPDSFVARKPWAVELCEELGLETVAPGASSAFVWTERGLVPMPPTALGVPAEMNELSRWPGLSRGGRVRALSDLVRKPRRTSEEESLGALLRRRLGDEVTERLVAPLLGGLFAGDVDALGVRATFPELERWERDVGSLIRGAKAALAASSGAGPMFRSPAGGPSALAGALADAVGRDRIRTSTSVGAIVRHGDRFLLAGIPTDVDVGTTSPVDAVVLATPAHRLSALLHDDPDPAFESIPYVSTSVVLLVYGDGPDDALPDASGFVVPRGMAPMTAATFLSKKWPQERFGGRAVVRCFVGAAGSEDVLEAPDADIVEAVARHLAAVLPLPERPDAAKVVRWPRSMPQYTVGHREKVAAIEAALPPGIFVVGNAYGGVGVADTVRGANEVAERVRAHLAGDVERTEPVR